MKIKLEFPVRSFRVMSKDKTHWHTVDETNKGNLWCDCEGGRKYKVFCRHKKIIVNKYGIQQLSKTNA